MKVCKNVNLALELILELTILHKIVGVVLSTTFNLLDIVLYVLDKGND